MGEVYARAISMFGTRQDCAPQQPGAKSRGYRLFWGRGPEHIAFLDLPVGERYAILGRHHCCDAVLAEDPEVSLRHLLAAAVCLDDGSVALRVLDLRGSMPFFLDDEQPHRSMVASGPVVLRLGRYVIAATPFDELAAPDPISRAPAGESAPDHASRTAAYGTPGFAASATSAQAEAARSWLPRTFRTDAAAPPPRSVRPQRATHVTLMPPAAELGQPREIEPPIFGDRPAADEALSSDGGRITVERGGRGASIEVSAAELDLGLIIGRADKCTDGGIRAVLNEWVSRAHLLILREGRKIHAFDLCSMNGTYQDSRMIRHVTLSERGVALNLGSASGVLLRWHGAGAPASQDRRAPVSREAPADSPVP
jgi:hypothetical protein